MQLITFIIDVLVVSMDPEVEPYQISIKIKGKYLTILHLYQFLN